MKPHATLNITVITGKLMEPKDMEPAQNNISERKEKILMLRVHPSLFMLLAQSEDCEEEVWRSL